MFAPIDVPLRRICLDKIVSCFVLTRYRCSLTIRAPKSMDLSINMFSFILSPTTLYLKTSDHATIIHYSFLSLQYSFGKSCRLWWIMKTENWIINNTKKKSRRLSSTGFSLWWERVDSNHRSRNNRFTVCPIWPLWNSPVFSIARCRLVDLKQLRTNAALLCCRQIVPRRQCDTL